MGIFLLLFAVYFIPTAIAIIRNHHNEGAIITLNVLAGWTFIGWLAALVWSLTSPPRQTGATSAKPTKPPAPAAATEDNQLQTALRHIENILDACREVSKPAFDVLIVAAQSDGKIGRDDIRIIANLFIKHGADIKPAWLDSLAALNAGVAMSVTGDQQSDEEIAALETASPAFKAGVYGAYIAMTVGNKRQTAVAKSIGEQLEALLAMPPATEAATAYMLSENKERNQSPAPVKYPPAAPPVEIKPLTWVEQAQKEVEEERRRKTTR